jgi:iron-sulfur cluster repair protein YtfE (RIC family)
MQIKGPIRVIFYVHKAIRAELDTVRDLAEKLELNSDFNEIEERVNFLADIVDAHAQGEEDAFYPAMDELRRDISQVFSWDHKIDEGYFQAIKQSITKIKGGGNQSDLASLKRNVYALHATLSAHAQKEDDLLVPLTDKEMDLGKQGEMVGKISAKIPPHLMEKALKWIVRIISPEERADYLGIVKRAVPPEGFDMMAGWVREALTADEWRELSSRLPD